jgi:hypothetical protein
MVASKKKYPESAGFQGILKVTCHELPIAIAVQTKAFV